MLLAGITKTLPKLLFIFWVILGYILSLGYQIFYKAFKSNEFLIRIMCKLKKTNQDYKQTKQTNWSYKQTKQINLCYKKLNRLISILNKLNRLIRIINKLNKLNGVINKPNRQVINTSKDIYLEHFLNLSKPKLKHRL